MRKIGKHPLIVAAVGVVMFAANAGAVSITPEVDFRDAGIFGEVDGQSSFRYTETVNQIDYDFTVSARNSDGSLGRLWWDSTDGLGIRGGTNDEISAGQTLVIDFHNQAPLSHLFFADLFAGETKDGHRYDERGFATLNGTDTRGFTAGLDEQLWGDPTNGEAMLELLDIPRVDLLELAVDDDQFWYEFSLLGLTDPEPLETAEVPLPGTMLLMAAGVIGLTRRLRRS